MNHTDMISFHQGDPLTRNRHACHVRNSFLTGDSPVQVQVSKLNGDFRHETHPLPNLISKYVTV
jgi:hypothetical protein